jgi:class 3 adenylate cyclase
VTRAPELRYARSGDVRIAYQVLGEGPRDIAYATSIFSNIEVAWENPAIARFLERLASFSRLILFDKRGVGMSDPWDGDVTVEHRIDDLRAVLDATGSEQTVAFGSSEGAATCAVFAATYPERVSGLIMFSPFAVAIQDEECPWAWAPQAFDFFDVSIDEAWGTGAGLELVNPSLVGDDEARQWYGRYWRLSASPARARALMRLNRTLDIRPVLPTISVPTLVLHRVDETWINVGYGRYAAAKIPDAKLVELPGQDHEPWVGDADAVLTEIREFVTGVRESTAPERVLATVLFTDLCDSTRLATELGDRRWRALLDRHDTAVAHELERFRGRLVKSTGDGLLATFDGPARAIRCAMAICDSLRDLGLEVRCGLHTGEVELRGADIGGIGVHIGARVAANAAPGEVLVSRTVVDLVTGSGIEFEDRGIHSLKGITGEWQLLAVRS